MLACTFHSTTVWWSEPSQEGLDLGASCLPGLCQGASVGVCGLGGPGVNMALLAGLVPAALLERMQTLVRCQLRLQVLQQQQTYSAGEYAPCT